MPSPFKSAAATEVPPEPPDLYLTAGRNETDATATAIEKDSGLEAPPPGLGLTTVTAAEEAVAMSDARMAAVS